MQIMAGTSQRLVLDHLYIITLHSSAACNHVQVLFVLMYVMYCTLYLRGAEHLFTVLFVTVYLRDLCYESVNII